jgi:GAF domain-containing protein
MSYIRYIKANEYADNMELPFITRFSFKKVVDWWQEQLNEPASFEADRAAEVFRRITKNQALTEPFSDTAFIENNKEDIQLLLAPFFPSLTTTNETRAVTMPYQHFFFNVTRRFASVLDAADEDVRVPYNDAEFMYMFGCISILNALYGAGINYARNFYFDIPETKTGIMHRYRAFFNGDFAQLKPLQQIDLTETDIRELVNNFDNIELWKKKIPPQSFVLEGITIVTLFDVTREESISALKYDLLKKDALVMPDIVEQIRTNLRALLNVPHLKAGFISWNKERNVLQSLGYGFWNSIVMSDKKTKKIEDAFYDVSEQCIFNKKSPFILPEVKEHASDVLSMQLAKHKLKSYIAIPLLYNDELIGILELGSENANELNAIIPRKLQGVVPLFTTALNRWHDEFKNQLERIIRQRCTAIHPTVAWRFTEAAEKLVSNLRFYADANMEPIVFNDVYPLYGQIDIQGSSTRRSLAIQADLVEQLTLAKAVLDMAVDKFSLPVYKELQFRIERYIEKLEGGLAAGDENQVLEFLKTEIYPVFNHLHTLSPELHEALVDYEKRLDPSMGAVYKQRKDYEQSIKLINDKVSAYLDKMQLAAQNMFPHYFEKYKTDGVEHNLYIGQSLVNNKIFHSLYLQNLRLWQLLVMCETENIIRRLKPNLKTKLEICSLILVHSNPLAISFRMEEKRFDVDGAYNIRYEIIKKRIDKALVIETNERLTQPGKIAIVYSQDKEAGEYMNYLSYLQSINYIGPEVESLTLKDLQGVTGLKALRVEVIYQQSFNDVKDSKAIEVLERVN